MEGSRQMFIPPSWISLPDILEIQIQRSWLPLPLAPQDVDSQWQSVLRKWQSVLRNWYGKIPLDNSGNQSSLEISDIEGALSKIIEHALNDLSQQLQKWNSYSCLSSQSLMETEREIKIHVFSPMQSKPTGN